MLEPPGEDETPSPGPRRVDPWVEQKRREAEYRSARRRRRLITAGAVVAVLVIVGGIITFVVVSGSDDTDGVSSVRTEPSVSAPVTVSDTVAVSTPATPTTVVAEALIGIDESWLLDRGDGVYDWGLVLRTPPDAPRRSEVEVDVRLMSSSGDFATTDRFVIDGVGSELPGVVVGRLVDPDPVPARLEFDVVVGIESDAPALGELLDLRALERVDDVLTGRVRVVGAEPVEDVGVVFVWRSDDGDVVASVPLDIERVRPGVDARFEVDLDDEEVPDGAPDEVLWTS